MPRRRKMRVRARGPRPDWVYRPDLFDNAGGFVDAFGTYSPFFTSVIPGAVNSGFGVLYDSYNYIRTAIGAGVTNVGAVAAPRAMRAEGKNPMIHAVDGVALVTPSTWAAGNFFRMGYRFGIFEQTPDTGAVFLDPDYSMWSSTTDNRISPAVWANDRSWVHERRVQEHFTLNDQSSWVYRFRFRVRRKLAPYQCFGVYIETEASSSTMNTQFWLRTLVSDEG